MRLRLYSLKDRLLGVYLSPFVARADVDAVRQMVSATENPELARTGMVTNPDDYDLCYVGSFEDETGEMFPEVHASGPLPCVVINLAKLPRRGSVGSVDASQIPLG